jgi:hypothetical protein
MIYKAAEQRVTEARVAKRNVIYGGDFNCGYDGVLRENMENMQLRPTGNTTDSSWRNAVTASRIDHLFFGGDDILEAWGGPKEMVTVLTDHIPVFGYYKVSTKAEEVPSVPFQLWPDLKRGDARAAEDIKAAVLKVQRTLDPEMDIAMITEATVRAHRALATKRRRRKWRDGWSPDMMAMQYALRSLISIRRHLLGEARVKSWNVRTFKRGHSSIMRRWKNQLSLLANRRPETANAQLIEFLGESRYMFSVVQHLSYGELLVTINRHIHQAKQQTHGRIRTEQRTNL